MDGCAAFALFDLRTPGLAGGAEHDPAGASLLLGASRRVAMTAAHGQVVVREGQLTSVRVGPLLERHNRPAVQLARTARIA